MSVFDKFKALLDKKPSFGVHEMHTSVVDTPLPPSPGPALTKILERLGKSADLEAYSAGPEKILMPDDLSSPPLPEGPPQQHPAYATQAQQRVGAQAKIDETALKARHGTWSPAEYTPDAPPASAAPEGSSAGYQAGRQDLESESYRLGRPWPEQAANRFHHIVHEAAAGTAHALDKASKSIGRLTGLKTGGLFENWARDAAWWADYYYAKQAGKGRVQGELPEVAKIAIDTAGHLLWDIPQIMAAGPYGLAVHGAAYGLAEGGAQGMIQGGLSGAMTHGVFRGIAALPNALRIPTAAGVGGLIPWLSGSDDEREILTSAATWAILTGKGGRDVTWQDFVARYPSGKAGMDNVKATRLVKKLVPGATNADIIEAGGPENILKAASKPLERAHERMRGDLLRSMGLPEKATTDKLRLAVSKMDDATLARASIEQQMVGEVRPGGASSPAELMAGIIEAEVGRRGLQGVARIPGREVSGARMTEATGGDPVAAQAQRRVNELLRNPEYAGRGPIPQEAINELYNIEIGKLLGLEPLWQDPKWQSYFIKEGKMPAGAKVNVPPARTAAEQGDIVVGFARKYGLDGNLISYQMTATPVLYKSDPIYLFATAARDAKNNIRRSYISRQGYLMVQAPTGHPYPHQDGMISLARLVLEKKLGRTLRPDEVAHHKNEVRLDNSPGNLIAMKRDAHYQWHSSPEGKIYSRQLKEMAAAGAKEQPFKWYIENTATGELLPAKSQTAKPPKIGESEILVQVTGRGRPQLHSWGKKADRGAVERWSGGQLPAELLNQVGMAGFDPAASTMAAVPRVDKWSKPELVRKKGTVVDEALATPKSGPEVAYSEHALTARNAELLNIVNAREIGPDGKPVPRSGAEAISLAKGELRLQEQRLRALRSGRPDPARGDFTLQDIRGTGGERMYQRLDAEPKPGWVLRDKSGKVVKTGEGVTQRMLDAKEWPNIKVPKGVPPYPKDLVLHSDYTAREPMLVRDILKEHRESVQKSGGKGGGSTVNLHEGNMAGSDMWSVSPFPERTVTIRGKDVSEAKAYEFARKNADLLSSDPRLSVGTWYNADKGRTEIDIVALFPNTAAGKAAAMFLGKKYNQQGIVLLDKAGKIPYVSTGGTGKALRGAGWPSERARLDEVMNTGKMLTMYHFGHHGEVTPHAMGRGAIGAEKDQFVRVGRGQEVLTPGQRLKSNFYVEGNQTVEGRTLWAQAGKPLSKAQIDMGQLLDASKYKGSLPIDVATLRAGKRGWYDPELGQVRMLTTIQTERLGQVDFARFTAERGKRADMKGKDLENYLVRDQQTLTEQPGGKPEDYSGSEIFGSKGKPGRGTFGIVAPGTQDIPNLISRVRTALFDKFHPIHELVGILKKGGIDIATMEDPSALVRTLAGVAGKAEAKVFYKRFTVNRDGEITYKGESLKDIYKPHKGDMVGLDDFLVARRVVEIAAQNQLRPAGAQIETGVDLNWARRVVRDGQQKYGQSAKKFTDYFHSLLDEMQQAGIVSPEKVAAWKSESPNYAPMQRDLEGIATALDRASGTSSAKKTLDNVMSPIRKMRGSTQPVFPPTQAAVLMTYEITNAVQRNLAAQAIVNLRNVAPELADVIKPVAPKIKMVTDLKSGEKVPTIDTKQPSDVVRVMFDGKHKYFQVPLEIADSMKLIHETGMGKWVKFFAIPARTLRTGATAAPEFAFKNPIRDWQNAFINAENGFNPFTDFVRGLFSTVKKPEEYWKWKASGGEWSMLVTLDRALGTEAIRQMHKQTDTGLASARKYLKSPLGYLEAISEFGEKGTRLGVFQRAKRGGMTDVQAGLESRRASTDFAVRGAETKSLSALYTFLNARVQTTMTLAKSFKDHPVRSTIRALASTGIPSVLLYALNRDDPEYWKRSQQERDMFWFLPIDIGGRQVKLPKGEPGIIFGTGVERILQFLDSKAETKPAVDKYLEAVWESVSPIGNAGEFLPTFARPLAEWVNNKSYFYRTPLESDADLAVAPYLRFKPQTSETIKSLGKAAGILNKGGGISPIKLENTLRGWTGGVGRHALRAVDMIGGAIGAVPKATKPSDPMNIPGVSGFMSQRAVGFESEPARVFYEVAGQIDMTRQTLDRLTSALERDPESTSSAKEIERWVKEHPVEIALLPYRDTFNKARTKLAEYRKIQNQIASDPNLSGKEKREALDAINQQVSAVVDPLWRILQSVSGQEKR